MYHCMINEVTLSSKIHGTGLQVPLPDIHVCIPDMLKDVLNRKILRLFYPLLQ